MIFCGDLNVAHREIDLKNPKTNRKNAGFTDEEREKFSVLLENDSLIHSDIFIRTKNRFIPGGLTASPHVQKTQGGELIISVYQRLWRRVWKMRRSIRKS